MPNKDCSLESLLINGIESKDKLVNNVYHIEKTVEEIIIETYFISHVLGDASGDGIVNDTDIGMVRKMNQDAYYISEEKDAYKLCILAKRQWHPHLWQQSE